MADKQKLILIGNGMAGINTIEHLLKLAPDKYEITVFGKEPHPNYNRILLSYVLSGHSDVNDIVTHSYDWYETNKIQLYTSESVISIDTASGTVVSDKGRVIRYDKLIIATGSNPFMLPLPGADKEGVIAYRTIQDCQKMIEAAKTYKKAVVIGGGLLGLEAARGFLHLGMQVDVVHIVDTIMERQLDRTASKLLQDALEVQGMNFLLGKQSAEITGGKRVSGLKFKDGTVAEADLIVMAVGIRPNVELAKNAGVEVNPGIVVNDYLETSIPSIYAVGECAMHRGVAYGLVAPLFEQGAVLAKHLAGIHTAPYEGSVVNTKLKVSGVDVFSGGQFMETEGTKTIRVQDDFTGIYKKVVVADNKIVGAVLFGDISDSTRIMNMIRSGTDISLIEKTTILREGSDSKSGGSTGAAELSDDTIICGCNGVSKGAICSAIVDQGLRTVEEVKNCTTASRSCGGCKPLV
ncbi:MAG: nitrite reductase, partial [Paenibacillus sp.]|nr:nitrite reductase [Paenibacillus sp.]